MNRPPRAAAVSLVLLTAPLAALAGATAAAGARVGPNLLPRVGPVVISANETLKSDLVCTTLLIKPKVTVTTAGHNIYCSVSVTNDGTILTGASATGSYTSSYGGSGAGATGSTAAAGSGLATRAAGGKPCAAKECAAGNGGTPAAPTGLTDAVVNMWQSGGMSHYLAGAAGGSAGSWTGGAGAYGLAIRTGALFAGKIVASGSNGKVGTASASAGGGGGGGSLVLEYASTYKGGTYALNGGSDKLANGKTVDIGGHGSIIVLKGLAPSPEKIVTQPKSTSVPAKQAAKFTVSAAGNPAPSVQWQILSGYYWVNLTNGKQPDGSIISGAATGTLTISNVQPDETRNDYWAVVRNEFGSVDSNGVVLTVTAALAGPTITAQPNGTTVPAGQSASFTAHASGNPTPTVQWQIDTNTGWVNLSNGTLGDGSVISGVTTDTLHISNVNADENGKDYWALFSNSQGSIPTNGAFLTVGPPLAGPSVTTQPTPQSTTAGGTASFTAAASGNPNPTVQWQIETSPGVWQNLSNGTQGDGSMISGVTASTLQISNVKADENGNDYWAVFTNSQAPNGIDSQIATLTVNAATSPPTVTQQPSDTTVAAATSASFSAAATGNPTPTVQWQIETTPTSGVWNNLTDGAQSDGSTISGSSTGTLTIEVVQGDDYGNVYRANFTNSQGSTASNGATLSVSPTKPVVTTQPTFFKPVNLGGSASFTATAAGYPTPMVQWQEETSPSSNVWNDLSDKTLQDGSTISGSQTDTLTLGNLQDGENNTYYRAVFTNSQGTTPSMDCYIFGS